MTTAGWLMMTVSIGLVLSLVSYCLFSVLMGEENEQP